MEMLNHNENISTLFANDVAKSSIASLTHTYDVGSDANYSDINNYIHLAIIDTTL